MGADANIFQQFAQPVKSVADYMGDMDKRDLFRTQLQGAQRTNALADMTMQQQITANDLALQKQNALQSLYRDPSIKTQADRENAMLSHPLLMDVGQAAQKARLDAGEVQAKTGKFAAETAGITQDQQIKVHSQHLQGLSAVQTPDQMQQWLADGVKNGTLTFQKAAQLGTQLQQDPTQLPGAIQRLQQMGMDVQKQLEMRKPTYSFEKAGDRIVPLQTNAYAGAVGQAPGVPEVMIGQSSDNKANNARIAADNAATRAQAERHFTVQQNVPKYMETDAGLVVLPTRLAPGQVPVGQSVAGADGQPLGKPLKSLPPSVNDAVIGNAQSLYSLDKAIALLQGKKVDSAKGDPAATGWKGYLPQAVLNRVDPSGVDTRAELSDIGSLKIHDRSGAAVTVSESPRLMPFIPTSTDPPEVAIRKLTRLMEEAQRNQQALSDTYSKEQGYKPSPVKPGAAKASAAPVASGFDAEKESRYQAWKAKQK